MIIAYLDSSSPTGREGRPIDVFNHGHMQRDFTYVDDIVEGVIRVLDKTATPDSVLRAARPDPGTSNVP